MENDEGTDWDMDGVPNTSRLEVQKEEAQRRFLLFIRDFKVDNTFVYR